MWPQDVPTGHMIAFQSYEAPGINTVFVSREALQRAICYVLVTKLFDESLPELWDALKVLYVSRCGRVQEPNPFVSPEQVPSEAAAETRLRDAFVNLLSFTPTSDEPTEEDLAGLRSRYQFPE